MYGSSQDAALLLEVIASMDVPFDSPDLLPLPAAGNNSAGWCGMASMNARRPMVACALPDRGSLNIFHERSGQTEMHPVMYGSSQDAASPQDAASLLEVIASMDVPFDSPDLPAPPATVTDSSVRQCAFMSDGWCASMNVHRPMDTMHAGHDEENCIDWLHRTAHIPWVTVRGAVDHDLQQRSQSMPSWEGARQRAHDHAFDHVRCTNMSASACVKMRNEAWDTTPLGARDELRRKMRLRLAEAACVEERGAASDTRTRLTPTHDARGALTEPTTPSGPPSPAASARAGSATPLGARGELRRKMTQRLARSTVATGEPAGASGFGRLHGSCF